VNAQKPNPPDRTTSILNVAVPASSNPNPASIFVKYWWISIARVMANFLRGRKGRIVGVNEYASVKPQLKRGKALEELMNNQLTPKQRKHLAAVKELPCGVCGRQGESEAHHIEQHHQYLCIPLCPDCHRGSFNGIHGQKRIWQVMKKTELTVLNETIEKMIR
jgi:hypothetical protein